MHSLKAYSHPKALRLCPRIMDYDPSSSSSSSEDNTPAPMTLQPPHIGEAFAIDSSLNRPHSSCLLRRLPLVRPREHREAEGRQAEEGGEGREGGEDERGEGSSRRHQSRPLKRLLQGRQLSLSLLTLPLWPTISAI